MTSPSVPPSFPPAPPPGPQDIPYVAPPRWHTSAAAVASVVLGFLGCVPFVAGLLAVAFGVVGIRRTRDPGIRGRGLAIAGLVLGLVSLAGWSVLGGGLGISYIRSNPARPVFHQFTADMANGNVSSAHAISTGNIGLAQLNTAAAGMRTWGALRDVTTSRFHYGVYGGNETAQFNGVATFANTRATFWFRLVKQGGIWKVDAFRMQDESQPLSGARQTTTLPTQ